MKNMFDSRNAPITNNKIALRKFNDQGILDEDGIPTYPLGSNIPFIKYFDGKDITTSILKLNKVYQNFIGNDQI